MKFFIGTKDFIPLNKLTPTTHEIVKLWTSGDRLRMPTFQDLKNICPGYTEKEVWQAYEELEMLECAFILP